MAMQVGAYYTALEDEDARMHHLAVLRQAAGIALCLTLARGRST